MKKLNFCTCELEGKSTFSKPLLTFGIIMRLVIVIVTIVSFSVPALAAFFIFLLSDISSYREYYKQARYLKHTKECARRYALIAPLETFQGHVPEYGYLSNYHRQKSLGRQIKKMVRKLRKKIRKRGK